MSDALTPLEDLLRAACERGVTHLSLYPVSSADGKKVYWSARGTPSTNHKHVTVNDTDPVVALRGVLIGLPKAPKARAAVSHKPAKPTELAETPAENEITATVTDAPQEDPAPQQETIDTWLPRS